MSNHSLSAENMLGRLPDVLRNDPNMLALATSIASILERREREIRSIEIYSRIGELPEDLLDILANDFKVDWWDPEYTLEEKRATLKSNWFIHRRLGTPAAVVDAISAIYPDTQITEWWEYGGEPYHFRILLDATYENYSPEKHQRVLEKIDYYKNLRSVLDGVEYYHIGGSATQYYNAALTCSDMVDSAIAVKY